MNASFAQSTVQPLQPDDSEYNAILAAATAPMKAELGQDTQVEVERFDRLGNWAFLLGAMRDADGGTLDLSGTRYAERTAQGGMSDVYVALLKRQDDADWTLLDHAIGPSDVAWLAWPQQHAAPRALFGF